MTGTASRIESNRGGILVVGLLLGAAAGQALADEARDFLNVPTGSWYPAYYLVLSETRSPDGRTVIDSTTNLFRVTNTLNVFGRTGGWNLIVPLQTLSLSFDGDTGSRKTNLGDPKFVFDLNLFGAPARTREEFRSFVPRPYASLHVAVTAPLGAYDPTAALNAGSNRWTITPEVNYSWTPNAGKSWLELYLKPTFFTEFRNYAGSKTMTQDVQLDLEGHASHDLAPWLWAALDVFYNAGGQTTVDGVSQHNGDSTFSLGATANFIPWRHGKVQLTYRAPVSSPSDISRTRTFMLYVAHLF